MSATVIQMLPTTRPCVGQRIGKYRIVSALPSAGMADRWDAVHNTLHAHCTLTTLPFTTDLVARARRQAQLPHVHRLAVTDLFSWGAGWALVSEPARLTMRQWIALHQPKESVAIDVFRGAARGVEAAHREGWVQDGLSLDAVWVVRVHDLWISRVGLPLSVPCAERGSDRQALVRMLYALISGDLQDPPAVIEIEAQRAAADPAMAELSRANLDRLVSTFRAFRVAPPLPAIAPAMRLALA